MGPPADPTPLTAVARGLDIAVSMRYYWITHGTTESVRWLDQLLASGEGSPPRSMAWRRQDRPAADSTIHAGSRPAPALRSR